MMLYVYSDGECPNCGVTELHLNTSDLMECPSCHLVCSIIYGVVAAVMPFLGSGNFRFEDCSISFLPGTAFAKAIPSTVFPDTKQLFSSQKELAEYISTLPPSKCHNKYHGENLSRNFLAEFKDYILTSSKEELQIAWSSDPNRTSFYCECVMPAIANKLNLVYGKEEFKVDYVMSKISASGHAIPQIYIESENNYNSATHEIRKLCSLNTPLRILITVTSKSFDKAQASSGYQNLREWQSIVRAHSEVNSHYQGAIVVLVGSRFNDAIEFFVCAFRQNADLYIPLSRLVSRNIG